MNDPNGEQFPWKPVNFLDVIPGDIITNTDEKLTWAYLENKKYLGLYFSAEWVRYNIYYLAGPKIALL